MDGFPQILSRFAVTMLGHTSTQAMLDQVVREAVDLLELDGAGAVISSTVAAHEYLATSGATAMKLELLQTTLNQGPRVAAYDSGASVSVPDVTLSEEFPDFTAAARALGVSAVFAFPLRQGTVSLGVLDLYRLSPGMLGEVEMQATQVLVDVLTGCVMNAQTRADLVAVADRERNTVQRLRSLSDERNDFVSSLIHELGSPLASIAGFTELLESEPVDLTDRQRHYISAIHRNNDRLRALAADLLTLFSLDSEAAARGARTEVDLRAVIVAVRGMLASAPETPTRDVFFLTPDRPILVHGHREDLERMLSNLVTNAVKYTPSGGTITCALTRQDGHAKFEVCDTGIGIPAEEQGKLFGKFFRASTAKERGIQGTGLGLAIVKSVVESHAGTVVVSSRLGKGTRVTVRLPVVRENGTQS